MTTTVRIPRATARLVGILASCCAAVSVVAACSSGASTASTTVAAAAGQSGQPTSGAGGGAGGFRGIAPAEVSKIRDCLSAAGIAIPTGRPSFSGRPSGFPTDLPSGVPTDRVRPSGVPSGGAGFGGLGRVLTDPAAKAALEACGIAVPSFSPRARASGGTARAAPTASTTPTASTPPVA